MHHSKVKQKNKKNKPILFSPIVMALSDEAYDPEAQLQALAQHKGKKIFVFRHYDTRNRTTLARALAAQAAHTNGLDKIFFFVAGDTQLAFQLGKNCAGVHFPSWQLKRKKNLFRPSWLCSAAVHNLVELQQAVLGGFDMALLSPIFAPRSKAQDKPPLGSLLFSRWAAACPIRVLALGGIDEHQTPQLKNGAGWASVSAFTPQNQH